MITQLTLTDTLITAASPALTVEYARQHIRSLGHEDDDLIATYIEAAASYFMEQTGRALLTETRQVGLSAFPFVGASGSDARIELPHAPLQSVTSVTYIDADGVLQSFDDGGSPAVPYWRSVSYIGPYARRGFVEPLYGRTWPTARRESDSVRILYDCGYGDTTEEIPPLVKGVLCYLVAHFDTFRSSSVERPVSETPYGVDTLLAGFKYSAYPSQVLRELGTTTTTSTVTP